MHQPFLDLMNYNAQRTEEDSQTFLCTAPKTDGRFGFNPSSRFSISAYTFAGITPYGMQVLERQFIRAIHTFGVFNYYLLKELCESPLPDASVLNLVDNAVRIMLEEEPGEPITYTFTHVGYNHYSCKAEDNHWGPCGCDCLIEWDGKREIVSLEVARYIESTGRMKVIPFSERFVPRLGSEDELQWSPHLGAIDRNGNKLCTSLVNRFGVDMSKRMNGEK